jgi:hypothetical protein
MRFEPVDVLLYDCPLPWDGWSISRALVAGDYGTPPEQLEGADRVELMIRRDADADSAAMPLTGSLTAVATGSGEPIAIVEGYRLNDAHDMRGFYFAIPARCIKTVISRMQPGGGHE